ncbi:uncharacterized protein LOC6621061 [Drosophila sechellia]|uniref:GM13264 n=1 Tax=Drosophila sechellia TaxID=7238 RepID=B4I7E2_DROSE|nr:uncharacterized protein LOC6621061 [Drosophila sechellia]EDW49034.1 GM13264 [Drosophila sechellia]EDW56240.1 GM22694 [Drosophila sechellia]
MAEKLKEVATQTGNKDFLVEDDPEQPRESPTQKESNTQKESPTQKESTTHKEGSQSAEAEEEYFRTVSGRIDEDIKHLEEMIALNEEECNRQLFNRLLNIIGVEIEKNLHLQKK